MEPLDGVDETVLGRYRQAVCAATGTDARVTAARDAWERHIRTSHGDVFTAVGADDPVEATFADAVAFDFLVDSLLDILEATTDTTITNRDPRENTDTPVAFGPLHDRVLPSATERERLVAGVDARAVRSVTPETLRRLYEQVVDPSVRLALGEYYTPPAVAELVLGRVDPATRDRVLDPGCGAGVFLTAALDHLQTDLPDDPAARLAAATGSVWGIDLNPVAVKSAKLAYGAALSDALDAVDTVELPVFLTDALGLTREDALRFEGERLSPTVDALVGNPPWVPWERLPETSKQAWRETYVTKLDLQPHEGAAARLGHSNDDVSVPFVWACIHRFLRTGGRAGFVLKRDIARGPAGAVLRRLAVGQRPLRLVHVDDLAALSPFDVGANAAVYTVRADREPSFPVSTTVWGGEEGAGGVDYGSAAGLRRTAATTETELVPLDPTDHETAWLRADAERAALGECRHDIRHGLKDDADAVFGVDRETLAAVDADLVYPYLKSRHVRAWGTTGHDLRVVPQERAGEDNAAWLASTYPDTYDYLESHREALADRSSSWLDRGPFYSVFGLGEYTWAPYKLVWCRLGFKPEFAVVSTRTDPDLGERLVVPGDHYMFVATDHRETAHYLCALLNAAPYQRTLRDLASEGKASLSKAVVSELALPGWPDTQRSRRLAALSMRAHETVAADPEDPDAAALAAVEAEVDGLVERWLAETT